MLTYLLHLKFLTRAFESIALALSGVYKMKNNSN